jgi:hypothetical protein
MLNLNLMGNDLFPLCYLKEEQTHPPPADILLMKSFLQSYFCFVIFITFLLYYECD